MLSKPSVAVVILNWNGKNFLQQFLPSVVAHTPSGIQIIVADNDSDDDSIAFLKNSYSEIRIIKNDRNYGFAQGYNEALKNVSADYFVLLNSDVEVTSGWIEPVIELMEQDVSIAACQPKILSFNDKNLFEYAGAAGGWIDALGYPFCRGRVLETCETDHQQYDNACPVFWASGAALFVRAEAFKHANGFDETFFAHQEEIDLCWRLQHAGYKIYVEPKSVVYHLGGGTLPTGNKRKIYLNFRNNLIMIYKNSTAAQLLLLIPARFALDAAAAFKLLLKGRKDDFGAILKAQFKFILWMITKKQKKFFPVGLVSPATGEFKGSILWQYIVNNKKKFSEIVKNKK
ncbi:glycosyltransferase family 2 protein [soil metagenome]